MAKLKKPLSLIDKAFQDTMKSAKVRGIVTDMVNQIAADAGPGHVAEVKEGRTRIRGTVTTTTAQARRKESNDRNLTRAAMRAKRG